VNRRQRRAEGQRGSPLPSALDAITGAGACPDCDADAELTRDTLGIWHLTIRHDSTCPWLSTRTR